MYTSVYLDVAQESDRHTEIKQAQHFDSNPGCLILL